jgi:hypothetical protein
MRVLDETISIAAIVHGQVFSVPDIARRMAQTIRLASTLDFCDPVVPDMFGDARAQTRGNGQ